jgi:HKD family nuclease
MNLIFHPSNAAGGLSERYKQAFASATELLIVNAYLTEWDSSRILNAACRRFRMVIGKDFGITRKAACRAVMDWLPRDRKGCFMVAGQIGGFHPKAIFWREADGSAFAIIGSSNLTAAAFETNYEANVFCPLSSADYQAAKQWVNSIIQQSVPVSDVWLENYREVPLKAGSTKSKAGDNGSDDIALDRLSLPRPKGMAKVIQARRKTLDEYAENKKGLLRLFQDCANRIITSSEFYEELPSYWGGQVGGRIQGRGWERQGKASNFRLLAQSFLRIVDADADERDDVVVEEIDRLAKAQTVPARGAFLSEMLCLRFPGLFPVLNKPIKEYLKDVGFEPPSQASEGDRYRWLAQTLRSSLQQNPTHPAKSLAELDAVIWENYH